jgi:hypothetical protein
MPFLHKNGYSHFINIISFIKIDIIVLNHIRLIFISNELNNIINIINEFLYSKNK